MCFAQSIFDLLLPSISLIFWKTHQIGRNFSCYSVRTSLEMRSCAPFVKSFVKVFVTWLYHSQSRKHCKELLANRFTFRVAPAQVQLLRQLYQPALRSVRNKVHRNRRRRSRQLHLPGLPKHHSLLRVFLRHQSHKVHHQRSQLRVMQIRLALHPRANRNRHRHHVHQPPLKQQAAHHNATDRVASTVNQRSHHRLRRSLLQPVLHSQHNNRRRQRRHRRTHHHRTHMHIRTVINTTTARSVVVYVAPMLDKLNST